MSAIIWMTSLLLGPQHHLSVRKSSKKRELLSLIGVLSYACKAVRLGTAFLRRLIELSTPVKHPDHYVRLNLEARSDIEWWFQFANAWNGIAMMTAINVQMPQVELTSDASGGWGCGTLIGHCWFQLEWVGGTEHHITTRGIL